MVVALLQHQQVREEEKMKKFLLAALVGLFSAPVFADAVDCQIGEPCDVQRIQAAKPEYVGHHAATPQDMVCLTVLSDRPGSLVLAKGRVARDAPVVGRVVTSWRTQPSAWKQTSTGYVREICFPRGMAQGVLTLCNDDNRSVWSASETSSLRQFRRIPANDPACLLGSGACGALGL